jgi:hypothetical protein
MKINRYSKTALVLGITFVVLSLITFPTISDVTAVPSGSFRGIVFRANANLLIKVKAEVNNVSLRLLVLNLNNTLKFIDDPNATDISVVNEAVFENEFSDTVQIPSPGVYSLFVTENDGKQSTEVFFNVQSAFPHTDLMLIGIFFLIVSVVAAFGTALRKK